MGRIVPRLLIVCFILTIITLIFVYPKKVEELMRSYIDWMRLNKELGVLMTCVICLVGTTVGTPGALMTIGNGFIYNEVYQGELWKSILVGSAAVYFGTWFGSCLAFLIGRYVLRDLTRRLVNKFKIIKALDFAFQDQGFRTCFLFRLCPLVPFNGYNYLAGATSLRFSPYFFAFVGYIPTVLANVWIGTTIKSLADLIRGEYDGGYTQIVVLIVGMCISIVLIVFITCRVKAYLKKFKDK